MNDLGNCAHAAQLSQGGVLQTETHECKLVPEKAAQHAFTQMSSGAQIHLPYIVMLVLLAAYVKSASIGQMNVK